MKTFINIIEKKYEVEQIIERRAHTCIVKSHAVFCQFMCVCMTIGICILLSLHFRLNGIEYNDYINDKVNLHTKGMDTAILASVQETKYA